jgi:hypothetical protein
MAACEHQVSIMERLRAESKAALEEMRATVSVYGEVVEAISEEMKATQYRGQSRKDRGHSGIL